MMILKIVSLLVRLWVEISRKRNHWRTALSASLWGCELKWIIQNTKETGERVSLLVRLWVEISFPSYPGVIESSQPPCEAVSWNIYDFCYSFECLCQPPCETVSWNTLDAYSAQYDASSASLWGCELKWFKRNRTFDGHSQPPCEAVSWNIIL